MAEGVQKWIKEERKKEESNKRMDLRYKGRDNEVR
jgi:hypothetical protein